MDLFEAMNIKPMLIGATGEAFDDPDFLYELKLDGERCIAYLDPTEGTVLRNKRNRNMLPLIPELAHIHLQVSHRCVLDGELIVIKDGMPNFFEIQRRSLMSNQFSIRVASNRFPASFIAFDLLYDRDQQITQLPLVERKARLEEILSENERIAVSRTVENRGVEFYRLTREQGLEGIVAKRKDSHYYLDRRTKDWIKIKNLQEEEFVICGYLEKAQGVVSLVLGKYDGAQITEADQSGLRNLHDLRYQGHVTLGVSGLAWQHIQAAKRSRAHPFAQEPPRGNERAVWLVPRLVCTVSYMMKTSGGSMRQPVFKGLRLDKTPDEVVKPPSPRQQGGF